MQAEEEKIGVTQICLVNRGSGNPAPNRDDKSSVRQTSCFTATYDI